MQHYSQAFEISTCSQVMAGGLEDYESLNKGRNDIYLLVLASP